jgi:hypothetical protein
MLIIMPSLQECVQKKIAILHNEDPSRAQNQNVAIAYQHCRETMAKDSHIEIDSIALKNQVIASEGVLDYNGKKMAKLWEDLVKFDGKIVPIIDEHPDINNGFFGRVSGKETIYGTAQVHVCGKGLPVLCMDTSMSNDSPQKNGYSLGFVFNEEVKSGDIHGEKYDAIQRLQELDHIALTNYPRNPIALASVNAGDNKTTPITQDSQNVVKRYIAYDSFNTFTFTKDSNIKKSEEKTMPKTLEELQIEIDGYKAKLASVEVKEMEKIQNDSKELAKKLADAEEAKKKLESDAKKYETDAKKFREQYEAELTKTVKIGIDSLHDNFGIDTKEFDGKTKDFVDGALFLAKKISEQPQNSISGAKDVSGDSVEMDSINNWKYNADTGKMEKRGDK